MAKDIHYVTSQDGILAGLDWAGLDLESIVWAGDDKWRALLLDTVAVLHHCEEDYARVTVGDRCLLAMGDQDHVVALAFIKSHAVVKSLTRLARMVLRGGDRRASGIQWDQQPLGKEPDQDIALMLGVKIETVAAARRRRDIAPYAQGPSITWTNE